jgi:hypothetical protein
MCAAPLPANRAEPRVRSRDGHRRFLAALLGFIGLLHFTFSVLTLLVMAREDPSLATPGNSLPYLHGDYKFAGLIAGYLMFQVWIGLILGPLSLLAAYALVRSRWERLVRFVAWFNLIYVPTGTTVGTLLLIALRRGVMDSPPTP